MKNWTTIIFGASPNPNRYSYLTTQSLLKYGFEVLPLGFRAGAINSENIITEWPQKVSDLGVITMYINPGRQPEFYDYLIQLRPKKVIFNPGTENQEFINLLHKQGIKTELACTLVLLSSNQYATTI